MQTPMVNAPNKNILPLPARRSGKFTKSSTQRRHQANKGKIGLEVERIRALGALRSLRSKKKLGVEKRRETLFLSNEEKETWIEDYVERETAGARKRVEDAEAAVQQEQDDMVHAEIAGLTSREPKKTVEEMMAAIGDSLSDLASSDDGEDGEDEEEETEQGKLSEDDEPGWVMGTITKTVQRRMESFLQKQMKLDELTQLRWEDAADYFRERDKMYGTAKLRVPVVVQPQTDDDASAPPPTTFRKLMERLDIVPGISQMPQGTSRPGSSHIWLCSVKPQWNTSMSRLEPAIEPNTSPLLKAKPVEPEGFYMCIWPAANHHIDFGFRQRHGHGSCVSGGIDRQSVIFDVICL